MSETWGANLQELRTLAKQCGTGSQTLTDLSKSLSTVVNNPNMWKGGDADRLRGSWNSGMKTRLLSASKMLDKASNDLLNQAKEQEQASQVGGGSGGPGGTSGGPGGSGGPEGASNNGFWGPDWLADPNSPFRNGWDFYGYAKYLPGMRANLFDAAGMALKGSWSDFMNPRAWELFRESNAFSQYFNLSNNLFEGKWHEAFNLTEGSNAFKAFDGLGKGLGVLGVGLDGLDAVNKFQDGNLDGAAYSGAKALLGVGSFAPPPIGTACMVAGGALFLYDNVPAIEHAVDATGEAIADGAEAVGGAISDGAEAVGDFFGF